MQNNDNFRQSDSFKLIEKRDKHVEEFLKKHPLKEKHVSPKEIEKLGEGELMFLDCMENMGWTGNYYFTVLKNQKLKYYSTGVFYDGKTMKCIGSGYKAVIKTFKGLEDYYDKSVDKDTGLETDKINDVYFGRDKFKFFECVPLPCGNFLLVNRKIYDEINEFIGEIRKKYNTLEKEYFRIEWKRVSKIYYSKDRDKFLSSI